MRRRQFLPLAGSALASAAVAACGGKLVSGGLETSGSRSGSTEPAPRPASTLAPQDQINLVGPTRGLERSLSTLFTVTYSGTLSGPVTVTPSDGDANSRFYSMNGNDAVGSVSISPSSPTAIFFYAPASAGAKTVTLTNSGGLGNPAGHAYTATAATPGSATPFRLTRGGATVGSFARLQQCRDVGWQSGDVVYVASGTYAVADPRYDLGSLTVQDNWPGGIQTGVNIDTLTIQAEDLNNPPFLDFSWYCAGGLRSGGQPQALTAGIACHTLTLRGIHMRGHAAPSGSTEIAAAFWQLTDYPSNNGAAATFTFDRCLFRGWGDAVKGRSHRSSSWYFNSCVFIDNSDAAAGLHHDIYVDAAALVEVVGCTFRRTGTAGYRQGSYGHFVKSRCRATTVKASFFDAYKTTDHFGGANSLINTPSGGVVIITGNVFLDYGPQDNNSAHNILRSGEQQFPSSGEFSTDPLLSTHSYLIAQNTTWQMRGYYPEDGNSSRVFSLYHIPSNDPNGAVSSTGVPTYAMTGSGTMVPVTTTIRNNIVAHEVSSQAASFLALYPNNSTVSVSEISTAGYFSGTPIAGSPAVNDAALEWAGDYLVPLARSDTNRGARTLQIPAWVPATAWQWTPIAGTRWNDVMKSTTSGGVAPSQAGDPVGSSYDTQWDFGGVAYSPKNHEMWLFGGGHDGTTINALSRWNLGTSSPSVSMMCQPTPLAIRQSDWAAGGPAYMATGYHTVGSGAAARPKSPHAYSNNRYFDDVDEFVSFGLSAIDEPSGGSFGSFNVAGFQRNAAEWRASSYWPDTNTTVGTYGAQNQLVFESSDRTAIYYARNNTPLFKYTSAGVKTTIGSDVGNVYVAHAAAQSATQALIVGGIELAQGWRARFVDLTTGAVTTATVSGLAWPTDSGDTLQYKGIVWSAALGKYIAMLVSTNGDPNPANPNLNSIRLVTLEPTGASRLTAANLSLAGTAPTRIVLGTCLHLDPAYGVLLVATNPSQELQAIKVA